MESTVGDEQEPRKGQFFSCSAANDHADQGCCHRRDLVLGVQQNGFLLNRDANGVNEQPTFGLRRLPLTKLTDSASVSPASRIRLP